jgi:transposase
VATKRKRAATAKADQQRGDILDVLKTLLADGRADDVVALVSQLVAKNTELEQRLARAMSRMKASEAVSRAQLILFVDAVTRGEARMPTDPEVAEADEKLRAASGIDDDEDDEPRTKEPPGQPPVRKAAPSHLRRVENPIPVPTAERPCPCCGVERVCIGHDVTEVIELVPAEVIVRVDRREKLGCQACDGELVRAPRGDTVVVAGRVGPNLVADLLVNKYGDGLPLHRQKPRYERLGASIPVSTLGDQVTWASDLLRPLWRAAVAEVIAAPVMHLDGTGLPVLDRSAPGGKRFGSLWGYVGVADEWTMAAYVYTSTGKKVAQRPGEMGPQDILSLRQGYTVADASNLFDASFRRPDLIECGCNMHGRRYFTKALDAGDARAALPLAAYQKLYAIEAEVRDRDRDARHTARQEQSRAVWDELVAWCEVRQAHEPPASPLGAAIRYLLNHRDALGRFLDDGVVPFDNGVVERLHIRAALTRKNYLFAGSDAGGERAAIVYTILANCRLADVNPVEYLADVLPRLARRIRLRDLPALLPARWKVQPVATAASVVDPSV